MRAPAALVTAGNPPTTQTPSRPRISRRSARRPAYGSSVGTTITNLLERRAKLPHLTDDPFNCCFDLFLNACVFFELDGSVDGLASWSVHAGEQVGRCEEVAFQ